MKRKKFLIIILIIFLISVIFIFANKKISLKGKTTNLDNSINSYSNSLENNEIIESEYNNTTKLQQFAMDNKTNKILKINGIDYTESDIKLRQYFQREENEKDYNETINIIILYNEAKNRKILIEKEIEESIKKEIYDIKFQKEFLENTQHSQDELKDKLFKISMEYELVKELKINIDQEIMSNNISIDNLLIKFDTRNLYKLYKKINRYSQKENSDNLKQKKLYEEYREKFKKIQNEYLNYIKGKYEVEYL